MPGQRLSGPVTLFYAYAHEDEALREQLEQHLALLQRQGLLLPWHDRQIEAGEDWKHAINDYLEAASIILLLISPAFLASDYCYEVEMQRALERHKQGEARVIPVILRPCDWQTAPFGHLQPLPRNGQAITTWTNHDEAFLRVSQNRANMLVKLQRMYDEVLDDSLQKLAWIDLPLNTVPVAVHTSANLLLRRTTMPTQPLAPGTTIQQAYQQANQELLILGEPGAGKSILLYHLGRDLLTQAQHSQQPLPVVFPLSSWPQKHLPLDQWMVEQLCSPLYEVQRKQSQQWIHNQQILPLLDGLDEVEEAARPACIAAINSYHRKHSTPLVVCSRSMEYQIAPHHERLHLHSAVEVQPLTAMQQEEAIQQMGNAAAGLRAELATNEELHELAHTPLWLNVLLVTIKEAPLPPLPQEHDALQQEVLRRYIERMCERKGDVAHYPLKQTLHWLGFLAGQMRQRNQALFAFEELQPDWLPRRSRRAYRWSVVLLGGLLFGLLFGLLGGLLSGLIFGLVNGLVNGLLFGLLFGLESKVRLAERLIWSWKGIRSVLLGVLLFGLSFAEIDDLGLEPHSGSVSPLSFWLRFWLLVGLLVGLSFGLIFWLDRKQVSERATSSSGKGISRSVRNGLLVGLLVGLFVGLSFGLIFGLLVGLVSGLIGGLLGGLIFGLIFGLGPAFQHLMLRFWLARANCLPWQDIAFLNDTCERALLKRVGGTYRFIHRLVLDYFADQEQLSTHTSLDPATAETSD